MPKGIYAAASAMVVETRAQEVVARNIAHTQTPGYRQESALRTSFSEALGLSGGIDRAGGAGVLPNQSFFRFTQGNHELTGATYDVAIAGNGFLRVRDTNGKLLLTRAGHFATDPQGQLTTPEGWKVEGQGGAITIPPDARRITIGSDGRITAELGEGANAQQQTIDQLRIVNVAEPSKMLAQNGVYFDPGDQTQSDEANAQLHQGYLEKSNLDPLQEMAQMIAIQRRFDAAQRAVKEQANSGSSLNDLLRA